MEQEEVWRLKNREKWLKSGEKNTKCFQAYAKGRKYQNTIWSLRNEENEDITSFERPSSLGIAHFKILFKENNRTNLAEIIHLSQFFPGFITPKENQEFMEEISE